MRRFILILAAIGFFAIASSTEAATGRVIKVLPQFLDAQGRHALTPSLYDRDAYQAQLREHPDQRSGIRFAIQWKAHGNGDAQLKLRVEMRGTAHGDLPPRCALEQEVKPGGLFSHWAYLPLKGEDYKKLGEVTAWRVTLWDGDKLLGEQKSFLW